MDATEPARPTNPRQGLRVLYIPVEFSSWKMARSMSYDIQLGLEEGFHANGLEVVTLPALWEYTSSAPGSWLSRAKGLLAGQQFDQVWIILVHCHYEDDFLDWLRTLAPVRVGFIHESLEYNPEECQAHPPFKYRRGYVERQIRAMTHIVTSDEYDAGRLNADGLAKALWWPGCVPARLIAPPIGGREKLPAVFCGTVYGERATLLQREDLRHLLARAPGPEDATLLPQIFNKLQEDTAKFLLSGVAVTTEHLDVYLSALRKLRRDSFDLWMAALPNACAHVNLPSLVKTYAGRVIQAMAAGCPVISWDVPNRPRNRNLFCAGEEILLFRRDQPADLAAHIRHLREEPEWARQLAVRAQAKVIAFHTIEKRIRQVLDWVATGLLPEYGETPAVATNSDDSQTNLFIADPTPNPNTDELARWTRISALIEKIIDGQPAEKNRRLLDLGCGRGWLTRLVSKFGESEGVEAMAIVAAQARRLFPDLRFVTGDVDTVLNAPDFRPYDFVLASEMIEYVPQEQQAEFVRKLGRLLKPGGHVIVSTPRGESLQEWTRLWDYPGHPVEAWLAEPALRQLFARENFSVAGHQRVFFNMAERRYVSGDAGKTDNHLLALYQVWAFQFSGAQAAVAVPPIVKPEEVRAEYHRVCREALERALQLLPDDPILVSARALALLELGDPEAARQTLVGFIALEANYAPARRLLARVLQQLGRAQEAEAQISRAAQIEAAPPPPVSVAIPGCNPAGCVPEAAAKEFSFLHHVHAAKLPDGSPAQLDTRTATIGRRTAPCIYLRPAAKLSFAVPCPEPGRLTCAISLLPEAWNKATPVGCEFFIHSDGREIYRAAINPRRIPTDRRWHEIEIDIPAATGPSHEFIFCTKAAGSQPDFRWAVWCDPVFRAQTSLTA